MRATVRWTVDDPKPPARWDGPTVFYRPYPKGTPLFPYNAPTTMDVVQGSLANCGLLSALRAILVAPRGIAWIRSMFEDNGAWVAVRLYRRVGDGGGLTDHAIKVRKSWLMRGEKIAGMRTFARPRGTFYWGDPVSPKCAPWVLVLEKAYAIIRAGAPVLDMAVVQRPKNPMPAFEAILGTEAKDYNTQPPAPGRISQLANILGAARWCEASNKPIPYMNRIPSNLRPNVDDAVWDEYVRWMTRSVADAWKALVDRYGELVTPGGVPADNDTEGALRWALRVDDVARFLEAHRCPDRTRGAILAVVASTAKLPGILPGKHGTGLYSVDHMKVYNEIKRDLPQGPVAAGTGYVGQAGRTGLVRNHAYAVVGVTEHDGLKFVVVQNPHSPIGASTDKGREIELADFCKRFLFMIASRIPDAVPSPASTKKSWWKR